jgi:hypothetical protein
MVDLPKAIELRSLGDPEPFSSSFHMAHTSRSVPRLAGCEAEVGKGVHVSLRQLLGAELEVKALFGKQQLNSP